MKIVVLNGSPKGAAGVTGQYTAWLAGEFPEHRFRVLPVARTVRRLERDPQAWAEVLAEVGSADGVLWAFPLYILLVCSQYKRFIELIREKGGEEAFRGRYAAALSTSIHFFDNTAQQYIHSICDDLGMRYTGFYAARMDDLTRPEERRRLALFGRDFLESIARRTPTPRAHPPLPESSFRFEPGEPARQVPTEGKRIVIVSDARPEDRNLSAMVDRLRRAFCGPVEVANLRDLDIRGGCHGCLRCGAENRCAWTGRDGFIDFYNQRLAPADILVFAGAIVARQLSWKWREFFDRSFFNTHQPSLCGKQAAFLVSGPLGRLPELRAVYEAWMEIQRSNLVAFVSDEAESSGELEAQLDGLAERLVRLSREGYLRPMTFLGFGGMKVFRDDIWTELRIVFRADHRFYRRHGYYDFPAAGRMLFVRAAWLLTGLPGIRRKFPATIREGMLRPFRKVLAGQGGKGRRSPPGREPRASARVAPRRSSTGRMAAK